MILFYKMLYEQVIIILQFDQKWDLWHQIKTDNLYNYVYV